MLSDIHDPARLLVAMARSTARAADSIGDPYQRRQLHATTDVLLRISSSLGWNAAETQARDQTALAAIAVRLGADNDAIATMPRNQLLAEIERRIQLTLSESSSPEEPTVLELAALLATLVDTEHRLTQTGSYYGAR